MKLSEQIRALPCQLISDLDAPMREAAAQLIEQHEAGPLVIELDQGPPSEPGWCFLQKSPDSLDRWLCEISNHTSETRPHLSGLWIALFGGGSQPLSHFSRTYPEAKWSRLLQIGGGE